MSTTFYGQDGEVTHTLQNLPFQYNDGGRVDTGFKGKAGDCVARAIAIAAQRSYGETYCDLAAIQVRMPKTKRRKKAGIKSARNGVYIRSKLFKDYMKRLGFIWMPTMQIGSGCKTHLAVGELPPLGRLVVQVSKHMVAVIDGVIHDTYDPSRDGTRCVYGYYIKEG
jgi:hypothetical protein